MYTTHGLMTPADYADHRKLYDLDCEADEELEEAEEWPPVPSRVAARDEPCADPATCDVHPTPQPRP